MGLFDVARGAAQAISKNAFPLHTPTATGSGSSKAAPSTTTANSQNMSRENDYIYGGDGEDEFGFGEDGRTRKRDVVSSIVTGGLASGIGWVLGAQPVNREP